MDKAHEEARGYFESRWGMLQQRERRNFILLAASVLCNVMLAGALVALVPLKEATLKVVVVDRLTGRTEVRGSIDPALFHNESVKKYWLQKYVTDRMTHDSADSFQRGESIVLLSQSSLLQQYKNEVDPRLESSPTARWGDRTKRVVRIIGISLEREDLGRVRFETQLIHKGRVETPIPYMATITFRFTATPEEELHLIENPLGFQATSWRLDKEIPQ